MSGAMHFKELIFPRCATYFESTGRAWSFVYPACDKDLRFPSIATIVRAQLRDWKSKVIA